MDLKQQHKTDERVINDMKLVQSYKNDEENHKYSSKIPTATWPPLQYIFQFQFSVIYHCWLSRQRCRLVSASDLQSAGVAGFKSRSRP